MGRVRKEWDTPKKARAKFLLEKGYGPGAAAQELERMYGKSPSHSQISRWSKQVTDRRTGTQQSGRPRAISDEQMQAMIASLEGHYSQRTKDIRDIAKEFGVKASQRTLERAWAAAGYHHHTPDTKPFLSAKQKKARLDWCLEHQDKGQNYWQKGIYTDESTFQIKTLRRQPVLRKKGERDYLDCVQFTFHSGRESFMVWGAIAYDFKGSLQIVTPEAGSKGFTQKGYARQILSQPLAQIAAQHPDHFCVEDNAPPHGKKNTVRNKSLCNKTRLEFKISSIGWPGNSPDLNPEENVWRRVKQELRNRRPHGGWSLEDLKRNVFDIWDSHLMQAMIQRHIDTMSDRIAECIARKGGQTRY